MQEFTPAPDAQACRPEAEQLALRIDKLGKLITEPEWDKLEPAYQKKVASLIKDLHRKLSDLSEREKVECLVSLEGLQGESPSLTAVFLGFRGDAEKIPRHR